MKIIFLIESAHGGVIPFKHRTILDKYGLKYEYWDIRSFKGSTASKDPVYIAHADVKIKKIEPENADAALSQEDNVVFITGHQITHKNRFFYKLLKKYNHKYIVLINVHHFFNVTNWIDIFINTKNGYLKALIMLVYNPFLKLINKLAFDIPRPTLTILGSIHDKPFYNFPYPKSGLTYYYSVNYEKIKLFAEGTEVKNKNSIVFLDQYLPWHNETQSYRKWTMRPETYYPKLAFFLKQLESKTGKKAIITTHPKAVKGILEKYIKEIPILYGGSYSEIASSSMVIAHMTTAIDYCVYMNKPMLIVDCSELENSPAHTATKLYAKELNKKVFRITNAELNSSDIARIEKLSIVDELSYKNYFENNLKSPTAPDMSYWEYIAQHVCSLEKFQTRI